MDDLSFVKERLQAIARGDLGVVAEGSGVPEDTLVKIRLDVTKNPRFETVRKLTHYFREVHA